MITCMTGISQCVRTLDYAVAHDPLTTVEAANCMADPRYMTWRMMTMRLMYHGAQSWYRTDSHWDNASFIIGSTWGPGIKLSTNITSNQDNNGTTNLGKTYVFAFGDGSGISLNHLTFDTVQPTTDTMPGIPENVLITPKERYTNEFPDRYTSNFCSYTTLELAGTTDTSTLATVVAAYSDGYYAKSTIAMEMFWAGAVDGWRGTCMVYYSSQFVQDNTNGSICHVYTHSSSATSLPHDYGTTYLIHILPATWNPPAKEASVTPSSLAMSDDKYGLVTAPTASTSHILQGGFYSSLTWFQPKVSSDYVSMGRYGAADYISAYCMQGAGSTSYFTAPKDSITLARGTALLAGAAGLLASFIAF